MDSYPEPRVVYPTSPHTHTFIILHGRGSNGDMFSAQFLRASTASGYTLPELFPGMKFICPTTKRRAAAVMKQTLVNQWFDILSIKDPARREELQVEGLRETTKFLHELISMEMKSVPPENIILGGLSQGCAAALHALMTLDMTIGAFVGMSGWFPFVKHLEDIIQTQARDGTTEFRDGDSNQTNIPLKAVNFLRGNLDLEALASVTGAMPLSLQTPVLIGHGEIDETVAFGLGRQIHETALALGMDSTFKEYKDYGHWYMEPEEIDDIADFLSEKTSVSRVERLHFQPIP